MNDRWEPSNLPIGEQYYRACKRAATIRVEAKRLRMMADRLYDRLFLEQEGSIPEREAKARCHERFLAADDAAFKAESDAIIARSEADGLELKFKEWQSQNATTRAEMQLR